MLLITSLSPALGPNSHPLFFIKEQTQACKTIIRIILTLNEWRLTKEANSFRGCFFNLSLAHKEYGQDSLTVWVMLIGNRENAERSEHIWLRGIEDKISEEIIRELPANINGLVTQKMTI